jgi:hypothetical protein
VAFGSHETLRVLHDSARDEASLQSALDKVAFKAPDGSTASTDVSQLQ